MKTLRSERIRGSKKYDGNAQFNSCCTSTKCRPRIRLRGRHFLWKIAVQAVSVDTLPACRESREKRDRQAQCSSAESGKMPDFRSGFCHVEKARHLSLFSSGDRNPGKRPLSLAAMLLAIKRSSRGRPGRQNNPGALAESPSFAASLPPSFFDIM